MWFYIGLDSGLVFIKLKGLIIVFCFFFNLIDVKFNLFLLFLLMCEIFNFLLFCNFFKICDDIFFVF